MVKYLFHINSHIWLNVMLKHCKILIGKMNKQKKKLRKRKEKEYYLLYINMF